MAVVSDLSSDARVRREAAALADAGHRVSVIGFDYQVRRPVRRDADGVLYRLLPFPARGSSRPRRLSGAAMFFARASIAVLAAPADAVHAHNLHLTLPCALAARLRRAKLVYDAHELTVPMVRRRFRGLAARYERMIWRRADAVVTTNESRARFFSRLHGGPAPLVLGNYPVEPPAVQPEDLRRRFSIPSDGRILLYQGGLYVADRCFEAVATALRDLPEWHWVLVGFGSPRNLARLARSCEPRTSATAPISSRGCTSTTTSATPTSSSSTSWRASRRWAATSRRCGGRCSTTRRGRWGRSSTPRTRPRSSWRSSIWSRICRSCGAVPGASRAAVYRGGWRARK